MERSIGSSTKSHVEEDLEITSVGQALDHLRTNQEFLDLESKSLTQTLSIQEFHNETHNGWMFELTVDGLSKKFFVGQDGQIILLEIASVVGTHRLVLSMQTIELAGPAH